MICPLVSPKYFCDPTHFSETPGGALLPEHLTPLNYLITLNLQMGLNLAQHAKCNVSKGMTRPPKFGKLMKVNQTLCHIQNTPIRFLQGQWRQLIS